MKLNKFAYLYSKPLGNHTLKIMKKIPGNLLKNLEKSWKYHGITPAAALTTKKKHEPSVTPVRSEREPMKRVNFPVFKSLEQRKPTSVDEKEVCLISLPTN